MLIRYCFVLAKDCYLFILDVKVHFELADIGDEVGNMLVGRCCSCSCSLGVMARDRKTCSAVGCGSDAHIEQFRCEGRFVNGSLIVESEAKKTAERQNI